MKNLKKKALAGAIAGVFAFGAGFYAAPDSSLPSLTIMQAAEAAAQWEQGAITAEGFGTPPMGTYGSKASIMARRAAIVDAQRNLAEQINGVQVDAETTVENFVISSDLVKTKVSALIKGAMVVEEQMMPDGAYRVVMSMPMYGTQGLSSAIMPAIRPNTPPTPPPPVISATITAQIQTSGVGYTGVIVDASGMGLKPSFSPVIYDTNGRAIYGVSNINYDQAISQGMVGYSSSLSSAQTLPRIGGSPLVVKAVQVRGGNNSTNPVNVVVSVDDGDRILAANAQSQMLMNGSVVFVR
ncbi:LPP20 lipoprotein [Selenomonas sp. FOBRC6]|jgi:putative lipoprotein|uniref:LPP20 family lipoprotein n=1 Tax=Selenomonas sp. FOBRC6 TaxID=936572 RepID=UPI000277EF83|nr:LPP20 family lipoprotein [Selenomonas sp. FOBRC6]EJO23598.1 LPP20 lipoprotein [Selenomonas sp. FOBRC6]